MLAPMIWAITILNDNPIAPSPKPKVELGERNIIVNNNPSTLENIPMFLQITVLSDAKYTEAFNCPYV